MSAIEGAPSEAARQHSPGRPVRSSRSKLFGSLAIGILAAGGLVTAAWLALLVFGAGRLFLQAIAYL